jgi:hypothetical protein
MMALQAGDQGEVTALQNSAPESHVGSEWYVNPEYRPFHVEVTAPSDTPWTDVFKPASFGATEFLPTLEETRQALAVEIAMGLLVDYKAFYGDDPEAAVCLQQASKEPMSPGHVVWMCMEIVANGKSWPSSRLHRWVGYAQAVFLMLGVTSLEHEMDRVRDLKQLHPEG